MTFEPPSRETATPAYVPPPRFRLRDLVDTPGKKVAAVLLFLITASLLACYGLSMYGPLAEDSPRGAYSTPAAL